MKTTGLDRLSLVLHCSQNCRVRPRISNLVPVLCEDPAKLVFDLFCTWVHCSPLSWGCCRFRHRLWFGLHCTPRRCGLEALTEYTEGGCQGWVWGKCGARPNLHAMCVPTQSTQQAISTPSESLPTGREETAAIPPGKLEVATRGPVNTPNCGQCHTTNAVAHAYNPSTWGGQSGRIP